MYVRWLVQDARAHATNGAGVLPVWLDARLHPPHSQELRGEELLQGAYPA